MENTELTMFTETVKYSGAQIWIEPVCNFFEISVQNQYRKLKNDPILSNLWIKKSTDLGDIDKNGRVLLTKKGFVRWIQIINSNTVPETLRAKFILYQSLVFDFIYGSFEREELIKVDYLRLKKLKRLYSIIGREIQRVDERVKLYMDAKFSQLSLPLDNPKQIEA